MKPFLVFLMAFMAITTSEAMSLGGNKDEAAEQNVLTLQIHEVYFQPSTVTIGRNDLILQIHEVYSQPSTVIIMVDTKKDTIQSETFMEATNALTNPMIHEVYSQPS